MSTRRIARVLLLVLIAAPERLTQAQTTGSIAIIGGSSTDSRGIRSNAITVAPGLSINTGARSSVALGASGTRFENEAWSAGPSVGLAARTSPRGGLALTLTANASAQFTSYDARFITGDVVPAAEFAWHAVTLFAGARAAGGRTSVAGQRAFAGFPFQTTSETRTRTSVAPLYGAQVRLGTASRLHATVWVREDPLRIDGHGIRNRSAGIATGSGAFTVAASVGRRSASDESRTFGSVNGSLALSSSASLEVASGSYPSNRLTGTPGGKYLNAGISFRFGAERRFSPGARHDLPVPSGVRASAAGYTRLSIRAPSATQVELGGDWNSWQPTPARRAANGVWYADVQLRPGEYRYAFRVDGKEWRVPSGAVAVDDGFGGKSAYVRVPSGDATQ